MKKISIFFILSALIITIIYSLSSIDESANKQSHHQAQYKDSKLEESVSKSDGKELLPKSSKADLSHHKSYKRIDPKKSIDQLQKRERAPSSILSYFSEQKYNANQSVYLVSARLRSLPSSSFKQEYGDIVFENSGYTFFDAINSEFGMPTLYDENQKRVVLLTGRLILKDYEAASSISQKYGADLDLSMQHLNLYAVDLGVDVLNAYAPSENIELEMIEGVVHVK